MQDERWEDSEFKPLVLEIPRPFGTVAGLSETEVPEEEGSSRRKIRYRYLDAVVNLDSWESILDYMYVFLSSMPQFLFIELTFVPDGRDAPASD